jgi:uncharacterized phage protein gp47/JayE
MTAPPVGLTTEGLTPPTALELYDQMASDLVARLGWGPETDLVLRALVQALVLRLSDVWGVAAALYAARDPDGASGLVLSSLAAVVGVVREEGTFTRGTVTLEGAAGIMIPAARRLAVDGLDGVEFETVTDATLDDDGEAEVSVVARTVGAYSVPAAASWSILSPVAGWDAVNNADRLAPGLDREGDVALRARLAAAAAIRGAGTTEALRSRLAALSQVESVAVLTNRSDAEDGDGIPAHGLWVLIAPSGLTADEASEVAETIFRAAPAGVALKGDEEAEVTDEAGYLQTVRWSYVSALPVYFTAALTSRAPSFPADGAAQIEAAVRDYVGALGPGEPVVYGVLVGLVFGVGGVLGATIRVGTAPSPSGTSNIEPAFGQRATVGGVAITTP